MRKTEKYVDFNEWMVYMNKREKELYLYSGKDINIDNGKSNYKNSLISKIIVRLNYLFDESSLVKIYRIIGGQLLSQEYIDIKFGDDIDKIKSSRLEKETTRKELEKQKLIEISKGLDIKKIEKYQKRVDAIENKITAIEKEFFIDYFKAENLAKRDKFDKITEAEAELFEILVLNIDGRDTDLSDIGATKKEEIYSMILELNESGIWDCLEEEIEIVKDRLFNMQEYQQKKMMREMAHMLWTMRDDMNILSNDEMKVINNACKRVKSIYKKYEENIQDNQELDKSFIEMCLDEMNYKL